MDQDPTVILYLTNIVSNLGESWLENGSKLGEERDTIDITGEVIKKEKPPVLDEKQAARLEEHLLESNVMMKKGEAHFYARHCTIGMNYTIAQFKKEVGCAYETARSSMDNLVLLGYYRKEPYKNKFIYMPVKK